MARVSAARVTADWRLFPHLATWAQPEDFPAGDALLGDSAQAAADNDTSLNHLYHAGVRALLGRSQPDSPDELDLSNAAGLLSIAANGGQEDAQSSMALLHGEGLLPPGLRRGALGERDEAAAASNHNSAMLSGSQLSRLALAYRAFQGGPEMCERAASLYTQAAQVAVATIKAYHQFPGSKLLESVRLPASSHGGSKSMDMNPEAVMGNGHGGGEDNKIIFMEHNADAGDPTSLTAMGRLYLWGARGVETNPLAALRCFQRAALAGEVDAMVHLGEMWSRGIGMQPDVEKGMAYFEKAAAAGHVGAMNGLGFLHVQPGPGKARNMTAALHYLNQAAEAGHSDGYYNMGILAATGNGIPKNLFLARRMFVKAVEKNHVLAAFQLAKLYHLGWGGEKDLCKASSMYKLVAEHGPWGLLLRRAHEAVMKDTEVDHARALLYYLRAAELGYEVAQTNAAWMLERGMGVSGLLGRLAHSELGVTAPAPLDTVFAARRIAAEAAGRMAARLWEAAAEQGSALASLRLGDALLRDGATQDAVAMYSAASDRGSAEATFNLGCMLEAKHDFEGAAEHYTTSLEQDASGYLPVQLAKWRLKAKAALQAWGQLETVEAVLGGLAGAAAPWPQMGAVRSGWLSAAQTVGSALRRNVLLGQLCAVLARLGEGAYKLLSMLDGATKQWLGW
eukprot:jgi/Tetstr1/442720/TSEL_030810.t1